MTIGRWIFAVLIIGLVAMVAMSSLQPRPEPTSAVQSATVAKMSITRSVSGAGKLEPVHKVNVSSNITGVLLDLKVDIGSKVTKGEVIAQIDTSLYLAQAEQQRAQLRAAEATVIGARANLKYLGDEEVRLRKLLAVGVVSESEMTKAESTKTLALSDLSAAVSRAEMSRAALAQAQNALSWATVKAPIDGSVLAVDHRVGERVRGSDFTEDVILVLGSLTEVDIRLEVGEHDVVYIKPGQSAVVEIDAFPGQTLAGTVIDSGRDAIVKNAGTENEVTTFPVWVSLTVPPVRVLSGMSAQVTISTETHNDVVAVPIQAVTVRPADEEGSAAQRSKRKLDKAVFVIADGVVHKRVVEVGLSSETHVEIVKGLKPGEVVVEGPYRTLARDLVDGMRVTAEPVAK
ncbi:MAG TPA: efflux RND transporter periplasmic adaptor subunit [Kofleriaceae bacterium]|nr:efflux RND transporter periplasmic adaptor subunit [Kofleriaceae bacterium]